MKRLVHPGRGRNVALPVGGVADLALQLSPAGARTWLLRVTVGGRRREIGLGGYPEIPLAMARERAREAKALIRQGVDPVEERKAARAALLAAQRRGLSLAEAVDRSLAAEETAFTTDKHRAQWRSTLAAYAVPQLGAIRVHGTTPTWTSRPTIPQLSVTTKGNGFGRPHIRV